MKHYPTFNNGYTDKQREKIQRLEQENSNRKAQGMICGYCRFFKGKAANPNDGRCLASKDGEKNTTRIFEECGNHRAVYSNEIHNCYKS